MSECYCDYESPEFYISEIRRARKNHKCDECGCKILPRERYEHVSGKWNGSVGTWNTCCRCLDLREFVVSHVPCSCWSHGNMIEDVLNDADYYCHETVGLQFGALRRKVIIDRNRRSQP